MQLIFAFVSNAVESGEVRCFIESSPSLAWIDSEDLVVAIASVELLSTCYLTPTNYLVIASSPKAIVPIVVVSKVDKVVPVRFGMNISFLLYKKLTLVY